MPRSAARVAFALVVGLLGLGAWVLPAGATVVAGLHEAEVEVHGQGERERQRGFRRALSEVVIRMTGSAASLGRDQVDPILDNAARYVQSFRYRQIDAQEGEGPVAEEEEGTPPTHYLQVTFDASRLERDLRANDMPVWPPRRPEVLLWVGVDEGRERYIVSEEDGAVARERLLADGQRRGLPLLLPLLDVEDRDRIDFIDIRASFLDAIAVASERYRADTVLVGHVRRRDEDEWTGEWTLVANGAEVAWRVRARDREAVLSAGIEGATDRLAERYIERAEDASRLWVNVEAVDSAADFARVVDYLDSRSRVEHVELKRISAQAVRFRVDLGGRLQDFERSLALGALLERIPGPASDAPAPQPTEGTTELDGLTDQLLIDGVEGARGTADDGGEGIELFYRLTG